MQLDQVTFTSSFVRKCLETEIHLVYTKLLLMMVKVIHHLIPAGSVLPAVSSIALLQVTRQTDVMTIAVEGYRRLTLSGLAWLRNPWSFGGRVSHPSFATHVYILTCVTSTAGFLRRFTSYTTLSYPSTLLDLATWNMCE